MLLTIVLSSCNEYREIIPDIAKIKIKIYIWKDDNLDKENHFIEIIDNNEIKKLSNG